MARCKYPDSVCANMTLLNGVAYCDSVPCSLRDELPKPTNADRIRAMSDEELAAWIFLPDGKAEQYETCITILMEKVFDIPYDKQSDPLHDVLRWLQQPAPEEGEQDV